MNIFKKPELINYTPIDKAKFNYSLWWFAYSITLAIVVVIAFLGKFMFLGVWHALGTLFLEGLVVGCLLMFYVLIYFKNKGHI